MNPALLFSAMRLAQRVTGAAPAPPPSSSVTPVMAVEYVDSSGVRQSTNVIDNVTTISGTAPFFMSFYGLGSVSEQSDSDTPEEAYWNLGFLIDYGEGLGGNWSMTGRPRDTDRAVPVFAHTYTTEGTFQARMTCRDSAGNQAFIRVNVVISAPGAGTNMTSGVIPTFTSNTVYNAPAGGTWGNITSQLNGLHNVIIRKSGAGADPVFGTVSLDSRQEPNTVITRTRGIRFLDCDVATVTCENVGFDYCSFTNGRVRQVTLPAMGYSADQLFAQRRSNLQASNVRTPRGLMLQNTGDMIDANADGYVMFYDLIRALHIKNVRFLKTTTAQHNIRGICGYSSIRNCIFNNTVDSVSYIKSQGGECTVSQTPDVWPSDDTMVSGYNYISPSVDPSGRVLGLPTSNFGVVDCIFGESGSTRPDAITGFGPENNVPGPAQGVELTGQEHCRIFWTTQGYTTDLSGRYLGSRDVLLNMGAGAEYNTANGTAHPNRMPTTWNGPYYTTGLRPVVVP